MTAVAENLTVTLDETEAAEQERVAIMPQELRDLYQKARRAQRRKDLAEKALDDAKKEFRTVLEEHGLKAFTLEDGKNHVSMSKYDKKYVTASELEKLYPIIYNQLVHTSPVVSITFR